MQLFMLFTEFVLQQQSNLFECSLMYTIFSHIFLSCSVRILNESPTVFKHKIDFIFKKLMLSDIFQILKQFLAQNLGISFRRRTAWNFFLNRLKYFYLTKANLVWHRMSCQLLILKAANKNICLMYFAIVLHKFCRTMTKKKKQNTKQNSKPNYLYNNWDNVATP